MEARLSHHLAHHFSIYNDLRLRGSDTIVDFLEKLSKSSPSLKVLDLENCRCFNGKMRFLRVICSNILLLKYLSLRGTDATQLPKEINNLQELEVLDIRQIKVPASATRNIKLLKLKRLLGGDTHPSLSCTEIASVQVPEKVEHMQHMEVLSNVKPLSSKDLEDIGTLWQLRKLGVVIEDKYSHLKNLLELISNLHKHLQSLSITRCPTTGREGTPYRRGFSVLRDATSRRLQGTTTDGPTYHPNKLLESLSISGTTEKVELLKKLLDKDCEALAKVTLGNALLKQEDLNVLAKLPKLCCFRLRNIDPRSTLTFNKDEFPKLKYFLFEGSKSVAFQNWRSTS
ncbi:hypothetical protein BAE44_0020180 [Dichanthelium oligosanthes]|uniref:Disease resistance R13L4/SHOC-2-like LRR domain-containing protein n=1 Tax=Dichanthelium oligosanthes TaxID=888268 RepID=A0A1E5V112_9POAL|nr:hypothetical protein BAE44_0020180 [Dichanthelium oligosanthes]